MDGFCFTEVPEKRNTSSMCAETESVTKSKQTFVHLKKKKNIYQALMCQALGAAWLHLLFPRLSEVVLIYPPPSTDDETETYGGYMFHQTF